MKRYLFSEDIVLLGHWQKALGNRAESIESRSLLTTLRDAALIVDNAVFRELHAELTAAGNQVVVLDRVPDLATARQFLRLGARGYGNALMRGHFLDAAFEAVGDGLIWLHPELTTQLIVGLELQLPSDANDVHLRKLSERERDVALQLGGGATYKQIAERLGITPRTVKAHATNIYQKLNVRDRIGLALLFK